MTRSVSEDPCGRRASGRQWRRDVVELAALLRTWWARRHGHAPPADTDTGPGIDTGAGASVLWRMRTTVRDQPGALAALCTALAERRIDILTLQTHPLARGHGRRVPAAAPGDLAAAEISRAISRAGGAGTWIERADAHDLVDTPTRVLGLATRTALDAAELPLALRQLLGRCTIHSVPAGRLAAARGERAPVEGVLEETP